MRASLLCLGVATLLLTGAASGQITKSKLMQASDVSIPGMQELKVTPRDLVKPFSAKTSESSQGLTYVEHYLGTQWPSWNMMSENRVFLFDPKSSTYVLTHMDNTSDASGAITGGLISFLLSKDGENWTEVEVYNQPNRFLGFLNLGLVNPDNAQTTFGKLDWVLFCANYVGPTYTRQGQYGLFSDAGSVFEFEMPAPDNAPSDMGWNVNGDMVSVNTPNPAVYHVQTLNKMAGPSQYGMYGMFGYDFDAGDFTANSTPSAWDVTQFRQPSPPNLISSYNGPPRICADADGKLYMAVNNIFANDPDNRVVAVSTSLDQGTTWSAFTRMPASLLKDMATQSQWSEVFVVGPYDLDAIVVTGRDQFSYFYRVAGKVADNQYQLFLVEAKYDNGSWTLSKAAELNDLPQDFVRMDSLSTTANWMPLQSTHSLGNEIEVAITADGQNLLLKWIDVNYDYIDSGFVQPYVVRNSSGGYVQNELTAIASTDVYYCYRPINGQWSNPVNITNDRTYDHGTHIPPVIKDLSHVPLVTSKTLTKAQYNTRYSLYASVMALPDMVLDAHVDYRTPHTVRTSMFNAINPSSVKDEESFTFRVNAISPNPTTNEAEFTFTMDVASNVSVDLFTVTGTKLDNLYTGSLNAGLHGLTVPTDNLSTGSYYIALTVDGKRISRPLMVVR